MVDRDGRTKIAKAETRFADMMRIAQPYINHAREVTQYLLPHAGRYFTTGRDKISEWQDIIDETGTQALGILQAGLMTMRTNPASHWFRLQTADADLNERHTAKRWLFRASGIVRRILDESNTYPAISQVYGELGAFDTAGSIIVDDYETVIHHHTLTMGEYAIAKDFRGKVNTLGRRFALTVMEAVDEFGLENCSRALQSRYKSREFGGEVQILHMIEPREDRNPSKRDAKNMRWRSCYMELGGEPDKYLRESGFTRFPCVVPRWYTMPGCVWGDGGPATIALGSIKQLQYEHLMQAKGIEQDVDPAVQLPAELENRDHDLLPGGRIFYTQTTAGGGVRRAFDTRVDLSALRESIRDVRERINRSYHVQLFQPLAMLSDTTQRTRAEVLQRAQEALTLLGPVTQSLNRELDQPLITIAFERAAEVGLLPPIPPEMAGLPLQIEYIGPLALAQKLSGSRQLIDLVQTTIGVLQPIKPDIGDKLDADGILDRLADDYGVDPDLIVPGKQVAMIRDARNQAMAAKEQAAMLAEHARAAKDLSAVDAVGAGAA